MKSWPKTTKQSSYKFNNPQLQRRKCPGTLGSWHYRSKCTVNVCFCPGILSSSCPTSPSPTRPIYCRVCAWKRKATRQSVRCRLLCVQDVAQWLCCRLQLTLIAGLPELLWADQFVTSYPTWYSCTEGIAPHLTPHPGLAVTAAGS